jgi:CelD/BcsL family acetyltransferase involved in cellulose biosynthesis
MTIALPAFRRVAPSEFRRLVSPRHVARARDPFRGTRLEGATISVFRSMADAEELWRRAAADCTGFVFQSFEWQAAYQATIGASEGVELCIVHVADRSGAPLLLLPLGLYREGPLRILRFLGGAVTDYNAPLIAPGFAEQFTAPEFAALWRQILDRLPRFDLFWFRRMPKTIDGERNPMVELSGACHTRDAYAAHIPQTVEAFRAARSPKLFSDGRRQRRRLAEKGEFHLELHLDGDAALDTVTAMARQKSRRYQESGVRDIFAEPGYLDFYRSLTDGPLRLPGVHVSRLRIGDTTVATHWGAVHNGRLYWLMPGYEAGDWGRYSCGRLLLESAFEWCIEHEIRVLDLTVGDERYKLDWADHSLALYECIGARSLKGAVYVGYQRAREVLKKNERLRGIAQRLRTLAKSKGPQRG